MARLKVMIQGQVTKEVPIVWETTRIGREQLNHIRFDDPTASRFHAEIIRRGFTYTIVDRQSTNGTLLNGRPLQARELLGDGDTIMIGHQTLVFALEEHDRSDPLTVSSFNSADTLHCERN